MDIKFKSSKVRVSAVVVLYHYQRCVVLRVLLKFKHVIISDNGFVYSPATHIQKYIFYLYI